MARKGEKQTVTTGDVKKVNIQEGAVSAAGRGLMGRKDQAAQIVESAMSQAVQLCYDKGIRDPKVIKATQLKARDLALANINELLAKG